MYFLIIKIVQTNYQIFHHCKYFHSLKTWLHFIFILGIDIISILLINIFSNNLLSSLIDLSSMSNLQSLFIDFG